MEDSRLLAIEGNGTMTERNEVENPRRKKWAPRCKTGCLTCRARKVKCDEARPSCMRCIKTGRQCRYVLASASSDNEPPSRSSVSQISDMVAVHKPSLQNLHSEWLGSKTAEPMDTLRLSHGTNSLDFHVEFLFKLLHSSQLCKEFIYGLSRDKFMSINEGFLEKLYSQRGAFPKTDQLRFVADQLGQRSFREFISRELYFSFQRSIGAIKDVVDNETPDNFEKHGQIAEKIFLSEALDAQRMEIREAETTFDISQHSKVTELGDKEDCESPNIAAIAKDTISGNSSSLEEGANSDNNQSESTEGTVHAETLCEPAHHSHYGGFITKMYHQFQLWRRPDKPSGYTRVTWTSALGKPLYVDVEGLSETEAERLQDRLGGVAVLGRPLSCPAQCDMGVAGFMSQQDLECHISNYHLTRGTETAASASCIGAIAKPDRTHEHSSNRDYHEKTPSESKPATRLQSSLIISSDGQNKQLCAELRPRFLFLCISTAKSVVYCPIDVTHTLNDQLLFQAIRDNYTSIKQSTSWTQRFTATSHKYMPWLVRIGFKGIELFSPRYAELVSFFLMPVPKGDEETLSPFGLEPSYPPEDEVWAQRWEYRPCPKSFTSFKMSEAFVTTMLEPGHAYRDDAWLHLFPKKLHSELKYQRGEQNVGWGIHIAEGVNSYEVVRLAFHITIGSGFFGVLYSAIAKDASAGFTIAAWIATVAALFVASAQLRAK